MNRPEITAILAADVMYSSAVNMWVLGGRTSDKVASIL